MVTMDEVTREMTEWKEPIEKECQSLIQHQAIRPITKDEMELIIYRHGPPCRKVTIFITDPQNS